MVSLAISIMQFAALTQSAMPREAARKPEKHYTVQVLSVRMENKQALLSVCQSLRAKGHLVYYCPKRIDGRQYLRLRVGIFDRPDQARAYAQNLGQTEGLDHFVAEANVAVARFGDRLRIVTTPSGIWLVSAGTAKELYAPSGGSIDMRYTAPQLSPDGAAIAFYADHRILKITLDTGETEVLRQSEAEDDLLHSVVRWSPDGRNLAYLDAAEWELPTRLWVMRADGTEDRCLIDDRSGRTKVKSFEWHPNRSRIFCVIGPTHGTVSLGGSLCRVDLDGTRRTVVEADASQGMEVLSKFRIAGGFLEYQIAQHKPDGTEPQYSSHRRALSELD